MISNYTSKLSSISFQSLRICASLTYSWLSYVYIGLKSVSSRVVGPPVVLVDFSNLLAAKTTIRNTSSNNGQKLPKDVEAQGDDSLQEKDNPPETVSHEIQRTTTIRFEEDSSKKTPVSDKALYIPPPHFRDKGHPLLEVRVEANDAASQHEQATVAGPSRSPHPEHIRGRSLEHVASSAFSIGSKSRPASRSSTSRERPIPEGLPKLSVQATLGRNSQFHNISAHDREVLGGIEYCALKILLKVIIGP